MVEQKSEAVAHPGEGRVLKNSGGQYAVDAVIRQTEQGFIIDIPTIPQLRVKVPLEDLLKVVANVLRDAVTDAFTSPQPLAAPFTISDEEIEAARVTDEEIEAKIAGYEKQFGMSSEEFLRQRRDGRAEDSFDVMHWAALLEIVERN